MLFQLPIVVFALWQQMVIPVVAFQSCSAPLNKKRFSSYSCSSSTTYRHQRMNPALFQALPTTTLSKTDEEVKVSPPTESSHQNSIEESRKRKQRVLQEPALYEYHFGLQDPKIPLPHGIVQDVTPPESFTITEDQIRTLEQDGVVHIKGAFDKEWVEYLRAATTYQVQYPHFWAFAGTASKLYDYIQRNVWQTNRSFANFYYHSPLGDILRQCGRTTEIRISTDLLMVNPNKGFKWHQDNQNGPIRPQDGIRFWITMDETPKDYGAPVYLRRSHENTAVDPAAVFIDIKQKGLESYKDDRLEFRTQPGDILVWHPRTIHKIDGPADGVWDTYRRVLGGTAAKAATLYQDKRGTGGILSDLGKHGMEQNDLLDSSFFPIIYPKPNPQEITDRDAGRVGRSFVEIVSKIGGVASAASSQKFMSFFQVLGSRD